MQDKTIANIMQSARQGVIMKILIQHMIKIRYVCKADVVKFQKR